MSQTVVFPDGSSTILIPWEDAATGLRTMQ